MKKLLIISMILILTGGIFASSNSYSPRAKAVTNNSCPKNYTKKFVVNRVRCYENCRAGYRFKVKSRHTNNGGVISFMECVR